MTTAPKYDRRSTVPPGGFEDLQTLSTHDREPFFEIAQYYCDKVARTLDIGAGNGAFARTLKSTEVHLFDGNEQTVQQLCTEFAHVHLGRLPGSLPFDDGYFGAIHCSHLVEHLQPQDLYSLLQEMDRCLEHNGFIIVSAPLLWQGFYDDMSHVRPYSPQVFMNYLRGGGTNRTRQVISEDYEVVELRYRYNKLPMPYYDISYSKMWAKRALYRLVNFARRLSLKRYEVSGFTLVLRKGARGGT